VYENYNESDAKDWYNNKEAMNLEAVQYKSCHYSIANNKK
jgi:hypothetical protein